MALGYAHPDHLIRELTSVQLAEWMAYYSIEPWGEWPQYLRTGIVASTLVNINRRRGSRTFRPEDFMPKEPAVDQKPQSVTEMKSQLKSIAKWAQKKNLMKKPIPKKIKKRLNKRSRDVEHRRDNRINRT